MSRRKNILLMNGPMKILAQPVYDSQPVGAVGAFAVNVSGADEETKYQWQVLPTGGEWSNIPGATRFLYRPSAELYRNGYQYRCVIDDRFGKTIVSDQAAFEVYEEVIPIG